MFKSHSARRIISMFLLLSFLCTTFYITLAPVAKVDAAAVTYRIKNRFTNEYLHMEGKNGKVQYGALNSDWDSMEWKIEDIGDGTGSRRIRNVGTGDYLHIENVTGYVEYGSLNPKALSMMWYLEDAGDGYVRFKCVWPDHADYMHIENRLGYVESGAVPTTWHTAQWVLEAVGSTEAFTISPAKVVDNNREKEANVISPTEITSNYYGTNQTWKQSQDTSALPQFKAEAYPVLEALYNMSLDEALRNIRADGSFMTGESWPDVWTRDISYSVQLALAWIFPDNSKNSLMAKINTNPDEIIQDTGTGGSWPVSTDRVVWGIAAWEYYLSTGDTTWLNTAYNLLNDAAQKDLQVAFDSNIGLFNGETSFLDWRNQTYPDWFADLPGKKGNTYETRYIAESKALSTNVLYSQVYSILGQMGTALGKPGSEISNWNSKSSALKTTINDKFWMSDKGYYGYFLYPRSVGYALSKKSDALGLALSMYYGVADPSKAVSITQNYPVVDYGVPTVYPEKANLGPYHNKSIWPFVEAYYMLGAQKAGNTQAVEHTMKSLIRSSALFLTNKENFVYDTGDSNGTAVNSSRQLWSVAGYLSMVYRVIMGMNYTAEGIEFSPMVPDSLTGPFELSNFKYRESTLNVKVSGNGDQIDTLKVDGVTQALPYVYPANGTGNHSIEITLKRSGLNYSINKVQAGAACEAPVEPIMNWTNDGKLQWTEEPGYSYKLWDGTSYFDAASPYTVPDTYSTYNLVKISNKTGIWSDLGGISMNIPSGSSTIYEAEEGSYNPGHFEDYHSGYSGTGYVTDRRGETADLSINVNIPAGKGGNYILRYKYANSNSNDGNFCGIRSMLIDGVDSATVVFPNLTNGIWSVYNYSSYVFTNLSEGTHTIKLIISPDNYDENMSRSKNDVNLDFLELIKMGPNTSSTSFSEDFEDGNADGWTNYGGYWTVEDCTYKVQSNADAKSLADDTNFSDLTYEADISIGAALTLNNNAGILFRISNPGAGADNYRGYYAGIGLADTITGAGITLGKSDGSWTRLAFEEYTIETGRTYHMKIVAAGSNIKVYIDNNLVINKIDTSFQDGAIGLRNWNVAAAYDNIKIKNQIGSDATLKDLQVNGITIEGFSPSITTYAIELPPAGTTTVPAISATLNDSNADMVVTQATAATGSAIVVVTAENGVTTKTYTVNFTERQKFTDATLKDLQVNGRTVTGFTANTTTYKIELPAGTASLPAVTAIVNDSNANAVVTQAAVLPGSAIVVVTAEDGVTTRIYTVSFTVASAPVTPGGGNAGGGTTGGGNAGGSSADTSPGNSIASGKEMNSSDLSKLISNQKALTVTSKIGNMSFDTTALKAIVNNAGEKLKISIEKIDVNKLSNNQKEKVQDRPVYEMTVLSNGKKITSFEKGKVTVSIPYTLKAGEKAENIVIWYLTDAGAVEVLECKYDTLSKTVTFDTNHFSYYVIGYVNSTKWINPFSDVSEKAWYYGAVEFVNTKNLMGGTGKTTFEPNHSTTRAMIVTTLYKYSGEPQVSDKSSFTDVEANKWYSAAIAWAGKNGIAKGTGNNLFNPNGNVTREQLAGFFFNYAEFVDGKPLAMTHAEPDFTDSNKISSWAKPAIMFCTQAGIMGGKGNGILDPKGYATRAELSTMLMNFIKYLEKN